VPENEEFRERKEGVEGWKDCKGRREWKSRRERARVGAELSA
jgi:hypothetical protein